MAVLTALPIIPLTVGSSRVVHGVRVEHVCGDPGLAPELDMDLNLRIVWAGLRALQTAVEGPTLFEPAEETPARELVHAP